MKRLISLLLCVCLFLTLTSCDKAQPDEKDGDENVTTTTTTTALIDDSIGGDDNSCAIHAIYYHSFPIVVQKHVGKEKTDAFMQYVETLDKEDRNIVTFLRYCDISKEEFIALNGWEGAMDLPPYNRALFTRQEYVDAIFAENPDPSDWVFSGEAWNSKDGIYQSYYHSIGNALFFYMREKNGEENPTGDYRAAVAPEDRNILAFVEYYKISREDFIAIHGWEDKLDELALEHSVRAPYTYGQFVEAIYGDDPELSEWVFSATVFK